LKIPVIDYQSMNGQLISIGPKKAISVDLISYSFVFSIVLNCQLFKKTLMVFVMHCYLYLVTLFAFMFCF